MAPESGDPQALPTETGLQSVNVSTLSTTQIQWIKLKHPKKDAVLEKDKYTRLIVSPFPVKNWTGKEPKLFEKMGARATGRTLILLGELGDVQSVAPVSLSDMLPTPGVLGRTDMEELTGGRRAWVSEGGRQLVLKRRDVREYGLELVDLSSASRTPVPFEPPIDLTASLSSAGSRGVAPEADFDRIFVDDGGDGLLATCRYTKDRASSAASSRDSVRAAATQLFLWSRARSTVTMQMQGPVAQPGVWCKLPSCPFDSDASPRTSRMAARFSYRGGDGKWLSLAAAKTLPTGAPGVVEVKIYQLHVPLAPMGHRNLEWRPASLRLNLGGQAPRPPQPPGGAGNPAGQAAPQVADWAAPIIAFNESADGMAVGLSNSEGKSVLLLLDTGLNLMGKGIVMLRDFGSLTRVVWAGDRMVLAQDRGGKHCIVDPELPKERAALLAALEDGVSAREAAPGATSAGGLPAERWLTRVLTQRRARKDKPLGPPLLESFALRDRPEDPVSLFLVVGLGKRLGVVRLAPDGPGMDVQVASRNPMRSHVAAESVGTVRFAFTRARSRNLMHQRLRRCLLEGRLADALRVAAFAAGRTPLADKGRQGGGRDKGPMWGPGMGGQGGHGYGYDPREALSFPAGLPILLAHLANDPQCPVQREARAALALCALQATQMRWRAPVFTRRTLEEIEKREAQITLSPRAPPSDSSLPPPAPAEVLSWLAEAGAAVLEGNYEDAIEGYRRAGKVGWAPLVATLVVMNRLPEALELVAHAAALDTEAEARGVLSSPPVLALSGAHPDLDSSSPRSPRATPPAPFLFGSREIAHLLGRFLTGVLALQAQGTREARLRGDFPSPLTLANMNVGFESYARLDAIRTVTVDASSVAEADRQLGPGAVRRVAAGLVLWGASTHWSREDLQGYFQEVLRGLRHWARGVSDHPRAWTLALNICRLSLRVTAGGLGGGLSPPAAHVALERAEGIYSPVMNFATEMAEVQLAEARRTQGIDEFCRRAGELASLALVSCLPPPSSSGGPQGDELQLALVEQALYPVIDQLSSQLAALVGRATEAMAPQHPGESTEVLGLRRSIIESQMASPVQHVLMASMEVLSRYLEATGAPAAVFQAIDYAALAARVARASSAAPHEGEGGASLAAHDGPEVSDASLMEVFPETDASPEQLARLRFLFRILSRLVRTAWSCHCVLNARAMATQVLAGGSLAALASAGVIHELPQGARDALAWALEAARLADVDPSEVGVSIRAEMVQVMVTVAEAGVPLPPDLVSLLSDMSDEFLRLGGRITGAPEARARLAAARTSVDGLRALMSASGAPASLFSLTDLADSAARSREMFSAQLVQLVAAHATGQPPESDEEQLQGHLDLITQSLVQGLASERTTRMSVVPPPNAGLRVSDCAAHPLSLGSVAFGALRPLAGSVADEDAVLSSALGWPLLLPAARDWEGRASLAVASSAAGAARLSMVPRGDMEPLVDTLLPEGRAARGSSLARRLSRPAGTGATPRVSSFLRGDPSRASVVSTSGAPSPNANAPHDSLARTKNILRAVKALRGGTPTASAAPSAAATPRGGVPPRPGSLSASTGKMAWPVRQSARSAAASDAANRSVSDKSLLEQSRATPAAAAEASTDLDFSGHVSRDESSEFVLPGPPKSPARAATQSPSPSPTPSPARSPVRSPASPDPGLQFDMGVQTSVGGGDKDGRGRRRRDRELPPLDDSVSDMMSDVSTEKDWKQARKLARMRVLKQRLLDPSYGGVGGRRGDALVEAYMRVKAREARARGLPYPGESPYQHARRLLTQEEILYGPQYRPRRVAPSPGPYGYGQPQVVYAQPPPPVYMPSPQAPVIIQAAPAAQQPMMYMQPPPPQQQQQQQQNHGDSPAGMMTALANVLLSNTLAAQGLAAQGTNANQAMAQIASAIAGLAAGQKQPSGNGNGQSQSDRPPSRRHSHRENSASQGSGKDSQEALAQLDLLRKRQEERERERRSRTSAAALPAEGGRYRADLAGLKTEVAVDPLPKALYDRVLADARNYGGATTPAPAPASAAPSPPPAPTSPLPNTDAGRLADANLRRMTEAALKMDAGLVLPLATDAAALPGLPLPPSTQQGDAGNKPSAVVHHHHFHHGGPGEGGQAPQQGAGAGSSTDAGLLPPPTRASVSVPRLPLPPTQSRFLSVSDMTEGDLAHLGGFEPPVYSGAPAAARFQQPGARGSVASSAAQSASALIDSQALRRLEGATAPAGSLAAGQAMRVALASQQLHPTEAERDAERARLVAEAASAAREDAAARALAARQARLDAEVAVATESLAGLEDAARAVERRAVATNLAMERMQDDRRRHNEALLREALDELAALKQDLGGSVSLT